VDEFSVRVESTDGGTSDVTGVPADDTSTGCNPKKLVHDWLCGDQDVREPTEEELKKWEEEDERSASLDQSPKLKLILRSLLLVVVSIGVFMLCFWSLWGYTVEPFTDVPPTTAFPSHLGLSGPSLVF